MDIRHTVLVNAPIEKTFEVLGDAEHLKLWMDSVVEIVHISPPERRNAAGAIFRMKIKEGGRIAQYEGQITALEKPRLLGLLLRGTHLTSYIDYRLQSEDGGTLVKFASTLVFGSLLARVMGLLFGWLTRRLARKQLAKLKAVVEARA
jgi:uncharacterized protein YndB with AHSA1/START domain